MHEEIAGSVCSIDVAPQRYAWAQGVVPIDRIWELDAQNATGSDVAPQSK
eukprot:SAG11_NODE_23116_length_394_cov_4.681356_1_plen_49_part_01